MQIPEADGLFHKAIVMSGVSDGRLMPSLPGDAFCTGCTTLKIKTEL